MTDIAESASKELWLERARTLVPALRERVEEAEALRRRATTFRSFFRAAVNTRS